MVSYSVVDHYLTSSVGRVGLEPTRCLHRQILSLLRLPIPPPPRRHDFTRFSRDFKEKGSLFSYGLFFNRMPMTRQGIPASRKGRIPHHMAGGRVLWRLVMMSIKDPDPINKTPRKMKRAAQKTFPCLASMRPTSCPMSSKITSMITCMDHLAGWMVSESTG